MYCRMSMNGIDKESKTRYCSNNMEGIMDIYIVVRDNDGVETDVFIDKEQAVRWAKECDGTVYEDTVWTKETVDEMVGIL